MENQFSQIASLIGDPARAKILWALLDGRAYTATELAIYADTTPQNISMHLSKLVNADLLSVESQGRHRYYNYSRADVPYAIEAMANLIPSGNFAIHRAAADKPVKYCRTCYDHLAGKVGVLLTDGLLKQEFIYKCDDNFDISTEGEAWFKSFGIDIEVLKKQKRSLARPCLDWSERKHHLAGSLGAALLNQMIAEGWVRREKDSRTMIVTRKGEQAFLDYFKIDIK
ncbi:MAG TPA: winged helix-turn-helix domain-containing protein [Mucilaginibacter sp.]